MDQGVKDQPFTDEQARAYVADLARAGRYQRDVY